MDVVKVSNEASESLSESLYWASLRGNHGRWRLRLISHKKESRGCKAYGQDALDQNEIEKISFCFYIWRPIFIFFLGIIFIENEKNEDLADEYPERC
jgi:hypothetical protein